MLLSVFAVACLELHRLPQFDEIKAIFNIFFPFLMANDMSLKSECPILLFKSYTFLYSFWRHLVCLIGWINVYYGMVSTDDMQGCASKICHTIYIIRQKIYANILMTRKY